MLRTIRGVLWFAFRALLVLWGALAIWFSNLPWASGRLILAVAFAGFSVWALWLTRRPRMGWVFAGLFAAVLAWFIAIPPSHDRPWRREVAVLPRAVIDGNHVHLTGVRDFEYRSRDDFTERNITRDVDLSHLQSMDLYLSYWSVGPVGHTFVSFNFDNAPPVCISIETRPEIGEGFDPLASLFKQFELIYVVGEERDLVGVRAQHRNEEVFLYRLSASPEATRRLFRIYLERINELADRPEWYHLLKNSCTVNIVRYANVAGRGGQWDIRHLLNGWIDRYLYDVGLVETSIPFEELRRRSHITESVKAAGNGDDFPERIRVGVPKPQQRSESSGER